MVVEFIHRIEEPECRNNYLNLKDQLGNRFAGGFPSPGTDLIVLDQDGRRFYTKQHNRTQLWRGAEGGLTPWYQTNQVNPGTLVSIRHDPNEITEGKPVIHFEVVERSAVPLESVESAPTTRRRKAPKRSSPTAAVPPSSITLHKLQRIRETLPKEQFREDWGDLYQQLLVEERTRAITDISREELGRRAGQQLDRIHAFLQGTTTTPPNAERICDWIQFCYTLGLHLEAGSLLAYVAEGEVNPVIYKRAKRLAEASKTRLG